MATNLTRISLTMGALTFAFMALGNAQATTLMVGPHQAYKAPSDAARVVRTGDTVKIEPKPGGYYDCAVWKKNGITIEGVGRGVVLTDTTCEGKAIFVVHANDVTVNNITFQRAVVPDGNGAGIRAEGANLALNDDKFLDNQDGILAANNPKSAIVIRNSDFIHNGVCLRACAHGVYVGHIALLKIEHSRFYDTQKGHHIKSRAARTVLIDNHIEDGPNGTASYEVDIPNGGALVMIGNVLEKGPKNENHTTAVMIGEAGVTQPTPELIFKDNTFINDSGRPTDFVRNITATPARLINNIFKGNKITPLVGRGSVH